jgi:hypothetical protein
MSRLSSRTSSSLSSSTRGSIRSATEAVWDPYIALEIDNPERGFLTCVGYAPSKHRRCQNPIAWANRVCAQKILETLSRERPSVSRMRDYLEEVAECLLCVRYHRNQKYDVVEQWLNIVRQEQRLLRSAGLSWDSDMSSMPSSSSSSSGRGYRARRDSMFSVSSSLSGGSSRSSSLIFPMEMSREFSVAQPAATPLPALRHHRHQPQPRTVGLIPRAWLPVAPRSSAAPRSQFPAATTLTSFPPPPPVVRSVAPVIPPSQSRARPRSTSSSASVSSTSSRLTTRPPVSSTAPTPPTCRTAHPQRRAINDTCAICPMSMIDTTLCELQWCKAVGGCGQSYHSSCIEEWARASRDADIPLRCPYWYVPFFPDAPRDFRSYGRGLIVSIVAGTG